MGHRIVYQDWLGGSATTARGGQSGWGREVELIFTQWWEPWNVWKRNCGLYSANKVENSRVNLVWSKLAWDLVLYPSASRVSHKVPIRLWLLSLLLCSQKRTTAPLYQVQYQTPPRWRNLPRQRYRFLWGRWEYPKSLQRAPQFYLKNVPGSQESIQLYWSILVLHPVWGERRWVPFCRILFEGEGARGELKYQKPILYYGDAFLLKIWVWQAAHWDELCFVNDWGQAWKSWETTLWLGT